MASKAAKPYGGTIRSPIDDLFDADNTPREEINVDQIHLPPWQPRRYFDEAALKDLAQSIEQHGIIQPLAVRATEKTGAYELVAGERRLRAAKLIGLTFVPVVILDIDTETAAQLTLIENLQREDLNPVEETEGILHLLAARTGIALEDVPSLLYRLRNRVKADPSYNVMANPEDQAVQTLFEGIGRMSWESFVINRLPLLNLPADILESLRAGKIEYTKATALARLKDDQARQALLDKTIEDNLSLSQIRTEIQQRQPSPAASAETSPDLPARLQQLYQRSKKSKATIAPTKQRKIAKLLDQLESLLRDD